MIFNLAHFQTQLSTEGYFIRGDISSGLLYMDEKVIFGKALIKAHRIESEKAIQPRIVIEQEILERVKKFMNGNSTLNERILIDGDNQPFMNYLFVTNRNEMPNLEILKKHKDIIEVRLDEYINDAHIFSKYLWVANYHNYFVNQIKDTEKNKNELMIDLNNRKINFRHIRE